jgi:hypothetical protein
MVVLQRKGEHETFMPQYLALVVVLGWPAMPPTWLEERFRTKAGNETGDGFMTTRTAVVVLVLALSSCARAPRAGTVDIYEFSADEDAAFCQRSLASGHSDPRALANEYVARDGAGQLYGLGSWLSRNHACPGRPAPGWDIVDVVSEAAVKSVTVTGPVATAYVRYRRLGYAQGNPAGFTEALADTVEVFEMVRLADGWWLNRVGPPHPLASTILTHPNYNWPDSLRVLIERLAQTRRFF